jgi:alcohol dehydrogenase (NADP+)
MSRVTAYAIPSANAPFEKLVIERRDPGPHDVRIAIAYCGICHSDIHTGREEWTKTNFPLVPGHEITGNVDAVGSKVTKFKVGDRVGVGCIVDSCRECDQCRAGNEQYCRRRMVGTYNATGRDGQITQGGYSTHVVVDENYVLSIPDGIGLDVAAPLLCAGITTYSPLRHWNAGPGTRVAIMGMGGLGHLGVKIAHALGTEVSVLSQTLSKQDDGKRFGADHYYATSDRETFKNLASGFELIINTVSAPVRMGRHLNLLDLDGTMVNVGAPPEPLEVPPFALILHRRSWAGSNIGGIRETQEMLDFCAATGVAAEIEVISGTDIDEAWNRVVRSDVRYRFVIDTATFG